MLAVASGGLLVNALGLWIRRGGHDDNLNSPWSRSRQSVTVLMKGGDDADSS